MSDKVLVRLGHGYYKGGITPLPNVCPTIDAPTDCRFCDHRYGNKCALFDRELTMYDNGGDDWGFKRCDECKQAEVKDD